MKANLKKKDMETVSHLLRKTWKLSFSNVARKLKFFSSLKVTNEILFQMISSLAGDNIFA